jgi:hypothetical protein
MQNTIYKAGNAMTAGLHSGVYGEDGKLRGQFIKKGQKREFVLNPKARTLNYYKGSAQEANLRGVLNLRRFDFSTDVKVDGGKNRIEITAYTTMENGAMVKVEKPKVLTVSFAADLERIRFCEGLQTMSVDCHLGEMTLDGSTSFYIMDLQQRTFEYYDDESYSTCSARLRLNKFCMATDVRQVDSTRIKLLGFCDVSLGESVLEGTDKAVSIEMSSDKAMDDFLDLLTELNYAIEQERRETQLHPTMATTSIQAREGRSLALKNLMLRGRLHLAYANGTSETSKPRGTRGTASSDTLHSAAAAATGLKNQMARGSVYLFSSSGGGGNLKNQYHVSSNAQCEFWDAQQGFSFALKWGAELQEESGEEGLTVYEQDTVEVLTKRDEDRIRQLCANADYGWVNEQWEKQEAKVSDRSQSPFLIILKKPHVDGQRVLLFLAAADAETEVKQWLKLFTSFLEARKAPVAVPDRRRSHIVQELHEQMGRGNSARDFVKLLDAPDENQRVDLDKKGDYQEVEITEGTGQQIFGGRSQQDTGSAGQSEDSQADVSRCHFEIFYAKGSDCFWIADLRSTNGTFVHLPAQQAAEHSTVHLLASGHSFRVGAFDFSVEVTQPQRLATELNSRRHEHAGPAADADAFFGNVVLDTAVGQATPKLVLTCVKIPSAGITTTADGNIMMPDKVLGSRWEFTAEIGAVGDSSFELKEVKIGSDVNGELGQPGTNSSAIVGSECVKLDHEGISGTHCIIRYDPAYGFGLVAMPNTTGTWIKVDPKLGAWPVPRDKAMGDLVFGLQANQSEGKCYWYRCNVAKLSQRTRRLSQQLQGFYRVYSPANVSKVEELLEDFSGREEQLMGDIGRKYAIINFFKAHNPSKVEEVDSLLAAFHGREEELHHKLRHKYALILFFSNYNKSKVADVNGILNAFVGSEERLFEMLHNKYVVTFQAGDRVQLFGYGELDKFFKYNHLPATLKSRVRGGARWQIRFDWADDIAEVSVAV